MMNKPTARRPKGLKKRNSELKKMLTGSLLKKRVLKIVNARKPGSMQLETSHTESDSRTAAAQNHQV